VTPDGISRSLARSRRSFAGLGADHLVVEQESQSSAARNAKAFVSDIGSGSARSIIPEVLLSGL